MLLLRALVLPIGAYAGHQIRVILGLAVTGYSI